MNYTDRELLEMAAKAAGLEYECVSHTGRPENDQHQVRDHFGGLVDWNPLTDDGDALRLAVKLRLFLYEVIEESITRSIWADDPCAAIRRAIVCVAAEIGRNMK